MRVALSDGTCDVVLERLIAAHRDRAQLLCRILQTEPRIHVAQIPRGGFFVWIWLEGIADAKEFLAYCRPRGVTFLPGSRCDSFVNTTNTNDDDETGEACRRSARLCFADMDVEDIQEGAELLVQCYRDFMVDKGGHAAT